MSEHSPLNKTSSTPNTAHPRRVAREVVVQGIYQWLMTNEDGITIRLYLQENIVTNKLSIDVPFFESLWNGINTHKQTIQPTLEPWLDRPWIEVNYMERAVLILGAYELIHSPSVPLKVAINEALEVYKTFGGSDGHRYVNSILDRCASAYRKGI
jgi:transcription antitermination protein NusB